MWAPEPCLLARRSAEIIYKAFQDPSDPSGSAKMAHRATNLSYFTIIRHCQESPSHSIFGADGAKKQVAMEQPLVGAHGSGGAGDPGPAPNRSGCVRMRPARCGAGPGCSYEAHGALEHHPTHQIDLKSSGCLGLPPESLPSLPAACAVRDGKGAL